MIFHSYVKLPEGTQIHLFIIILKMPFWGDAKFSDPQIVDCWVVYDPGDIPMNIPIMVNLIQFSQFLDYTLFSKGFFSDY